MGCYLTIKSSPSGAKAYIGGSYKGKTPVENIYLMEGSHNIRVEKSGYISYQNLNYKISSKELSKTLSVDLSKEGEEEGTLQIESIPSGAKIYIDGKNTGEKTKETFTKSPGNYDIKLKLDGYEDESFTERVREGEETATKIRLTPIPGKPITQISVNSKPDGADVYIDGEYSGKTPISTDVLPGNRNVEVRLTGYDTITETLAVSEGEIVLRYYNPYKIVVEKTWWERFKAWSDTFKSPSAPKEEDYASRWEYLKASMTWSEGIEGVERLPLIGDLLEMEDTATEKMGFTIPDWLKEVELFLIFGPFMTVGATGVIDTLTETNAAKLSATVGTPRTIAAITKMIKLHPEQAAKYLSKFPQPVREAVISGLYESPEGRIAIVTMSKMGYFKMLGPWWTSNIAPFTAKDLLKPKTIIWGMAGILGIISTAYGIAFGTEWFAKEGLIEQFSIPLSDRMRDWRFEKDPEIKKRIDQDIINLEAAIPKAESLIKSVAWLWPFTKDAWYAYVEGAYFELEQFKAELKAAIAPELPEEIVTYVRDIIDGDTIDVSTTIEGSLEKLPQYKNTGHARVRMVGLDTPEMSGKKGDVHDDEGNLINVGGEWADAAKENLYILDDKKVTLYIDPESAIDPFGRILAVVKYQGEDINLKQIKQGLGSAYFREDFETNKYADENLYKEETLKAKDDGTGMWKMVAMADFKINITSEPSNAKLFLDEVALHHNTPSDEIELEDVMDLFTEGEHTLRAEKSGMVVEKVINITIGDNGTIHLILETIGLPPTEPPVTPPPTEPPVTPPAEGEIIFTITSTPKNAKLYLDEVALHHNTPSDEIECKDVINLFTEGIHKIRATKGGYAAEETFSLIKGTRKIIDLTLGGMVTPTVTPPVTPPVTPIDDQSVLIKNLYDQITALNSTIENLNVTIANLQGQTPPPVTPPEPPTPPITEGRFEQSWTPGELPKDDKSKAITTSMRYDINNDGIYSNFNFDYRGSSTAAYGTKIGETEEGWDIFLYKDRLYVYTGLIAKGFKVYYRYKRSLG